MNNKTLLLVGGGEHAAVVYDAVLSDDQRSWTSVFYVSPEDGKGIIKTLERICSDEEGLEISERADVVLAIGAIDCRDLRDKLFAKYNSRVKSWAAVVHVAATLSQSASIGFGTVVLAGAIVGPGANVGRHCIVNSNSVIEHDVQLSNFVTVGPSVTIGGGVMVGSRASIGIGAVIRDHVKIGESATIGMGAVVTKDVADGNTVFGNPARVIE